MRMVVLGSAVGAVLVGAGPVTAQVVVHDRDRVVVREHVYHGHHYGLRHNDAECPTVRVRTRLPNGNVIVKTRHTC